MGTEKNINLILQNEKLKLRFAALIEGDTGYESNKKEEIIERLQLKLGKTTEEINKIVDQF